MRIVNLAKTNDKKVFSFASFLKFLPWEVRRVNFSKASLEAVSYSPKSGGKGVDHPRLERG